MNPKIPQRAWVAHEITWRKRTKDKIIGENEKSAKEIESTNKFSVTRKKSQLLTGYHWRRSTPTCHHCSESSTASRKHSSLPWWDPFMFYRQIFPSIRKILVRLKSEWGPWSWSFKKYIKENVHHISLMSPL